jgi:hypothetical protein
VKGERSKREASARSRRGRRRREAHTIGSIQDDGLFSGLQTVLRTQLEPHQGPIYFHDQKRSHALHKNKLKKKNRNPKEKKSIPKF